MSTIEMRETESGRRAGLIAGLLLLITVAAIAIGLVWSALAVRSATDISGEGPRSLWEEEGLSSYRYTLQVGCFCIREMTYPVVVEVRDGKLVSVTYAGDGAAADMALFERFSSVEKLYAVIDDAAAQNAVQLDVVYDAQWHVPTAINIDISRQMADEELYLTVSDFKALP